MTFFCALALQYPGLPSHGDTDCCQWSHAAAIPEQIPPSIGPASYVVNTGDLQVVTLGKVMIKFVNDTYLIIPAANADSWQSELDNVELWSRANNLKVNPTKYAEIIFVHSKWKAAV